MISTNCSSCYFDNLSVGYTSINSYIFGWCFHPIYNKEYRGCIIEVPRDNFPSNAIDINWKSDSQTGKTHFIC